jgi:hypothetical protein
MKSARREYADRSNKWVPGVVSKCICITGIAIPTFRLKGLLLGLLLAIKRSSLIDPNRSYDFQDNWHRVERPAFFNLSFRVPYAQQALALECEQGGASVR